MRCQAAQTPVVAPMWRPASAPACALRSGWCGHGCSVRASDQRGGGWPVARRFLCRGDGWRLHLLRHARCRQYRSPSVYHPRLLHRLPPQSHVRTGSDLGCLDHGAGVLLPRPGGLSGLLPVVRTPRPGCAAGTCLLLWPSVHHRSDADLAVRRRLSLRRRSLYRTDLAAGFYRSAVADAGSVRGLSLARDCAAAVADTYLYRPRHHGRRAGSACLAVDGRQSHPHQAHGLWPLHRHRVSRRCFPYHHPADRALGRS